MTTPIEDLLVCSTAGIVYALNKKDGTEVWKTELYNVTKGIGSLFVCGDKIYVGMSGYLVALYLDSGIEIWKNSLSGMKYREISLLVTNPNSEEGNVVVVASYGKVCGIASKSGVTLWTNELTGGGYKLPSLMLDSSALDTVLVGCRKRLYKINIHDGQTIWERIIYDSIFGSPYVTMATHQSSLQAAFTHTGFNNNPITEEQR